MRFSKFSPFILFTLIIFSLITVLPVVDAAPVNLFSRYAGVTPSSTDWRAFADVHPSNVAGAESAQYEDFDVTVSGYLEVATVMAKKGGVPAGTIVMQIYSEGAPVPLDEDLLATSTTGLLMDGLTTSYAAFSFSFDGTLWLDSAQNYTYVFKVMNATTLGGSDYVMFGVGGTASYDNSGESYCDGDWVVLSTFGGFIISMYGDSSASPSGTPTPTPTPSPTPDAMPNWMSDILDAIIPIFTPLLVLFICGALGYRFAGAWGFFAGINLGIVLMYVIAPQYMPLWAIVTVVVVDVALLFGKVGFGNR